MKEEYDIAKLNPRRNPYTGKLKRQVTINMYFKHLSDQSGLPYQTLINLYLMDCANNKRQLQMTWN